MRKPRYKSNPFVTADKKHLNKLFVLLQIRLKFWNEKKEPLFLSQNHEEVILKSLQKEQFVKIKSINGPESQSVTVFWS
jgi:hypothetical protein